MTSTAGGTGIPPTLEPTWFLDFDQPAVRDYATGACAGANSPRERVVRLFYAVRDDIRYDPYRVSSDPAHLKASRVLDEGAGYCVPKAILLAACARVVGIPSRLGFADVKNHLTTAKLRQQMGSDLFVCHITLQDTCLNFGHVYRLCISRNNIAKIEHLFIDRFIVVK